MKQKEGFVLRQVCGENVIVGEGLGTIDFGKLISLNETAADIFKLIQQGLDEDAIVAQMLQEYDVTEDKLRPEVQHLIGQLRSEGLIIE